MAVISTTPPVAIYASPADDAQSVALDSNIVIQFQESVKAGSGQIVISNGQGDIRRIAIHDSSQVQFGVYTDSKYGDAPSRTLTINPTENLLSNSGYYVQVDSGVITSFADTPLAAVADATTYNFTTSSDNSAPIPLSGEYTRSPTGEHMIIATFNEPVKASTDPSSFVVTNRQGDIRQMSAYAEGNTLKLLNPSLLPNTEYFLTVISGAITDLAGNPFAGVPEAAAFPFKTRNDDIFAPMVGYLVPSIGSPVSIDADINLGFSEAIKMGMGAVTLSNGQGDTRKIAINDPTQISFNKNVDNFSAGDAYSINIHPSQPLVPNSQYTLQADPGIVTDVSGNAFAGITDQSYTFTTTGLDTKPPTPVYAEVAADSRDTQRLHIPLSPRINVSFDEPVKPGAGNFIISNGQGDTQIIAANDTQQVTGYDSSLFITPSKKLLPGNRYFLQVEPNAITDLAGNAYAGVQDKTVFTFTVEPLWTATQNPVTETNRGVSVGVYEPNDILTFHFNAPVTDYQSFKLSKHTFGGNDVVLSADGLSASVKLTAGSTVSPGDVVTLEGVKGITGADGIMPTVNIEFTL